MQMSVFREYLMLAKCLSFSTAAKQLYISQPALSNHIAALEKELGVTLVERENPLRLTMAGKIFLEDACKMADLYDQSLVRLKDAARETGGKIVMLAPMTADFAGTLLYQLVRSFKQENPSVDIEFKARSNRYALDELRDGKIDCTLFYNYQADRNASDLDADDFGSLPLATDRIMLWTHRNHPLAQKNPLHFVDLEPYSYPVLANLQYFDAHVSLINLYAKFGMRPKFKYSTADSFDDYLLNIVGEQDAIIMSSDAGQSPLVQLRDDMVLRDFDDEDCTQTAYLVYARNRSNRALEAFLEHVKVHAGSVA